MERRAVTQAVLFDDTEAQPIAQLSPAIREKALQLMVQWMQAVAEALKQEVHDEQDHL